MIPLPLTQSEHDDYLDALVASEVQMQAVVKLYDRNEALVGEVGGLIEGQVDVDEDASPTHSARLTVADPDGDLPYDLAMTRGASPKSFLGIEVTAGGVTCPIFFGPLTAYARSGAEVSLGAEGKEILAVDPHLLGQALNIHEHRGTADAIRDIMGARGERRFRFDSSTDRVGERLTPGELSVPWDEAQLLATEMDRQLFYDGAGFLRLRKVPITPVYTFSRPTTRVNVTRDSTEMRNIIRVKWSGGSATIRPEASHPLSPESLGRNGKPRYIFEQLDLRTKSASKAQARGKRELRDRLRIDVQVAFDHPPIWPLEPGDMCAADHPDEGTAQFRLRRFTLPLRPAAMVVGANRRISYPVDRFRVKRKRKRRRRRRRR